MRSAVRGCRRQRLANQGQQAPDVVPRGKFGYHPTIGLMHRNLTVEPMRKQPLGVVVHGHGRLVAGGLNPNTRIILPFTGAHFRMRPPVAEYRRPFGLHFEV